MGPSLNVFKDCKIAKIAKMDLKLFIETFGKAGQKVFILFNYVVLILIIQHFVLIAIIKHLCDLFPGKQVDCYFKGNNGQLILKCPFGVF